MPYPSADFAIDNFMPSETKISGGQSKGSTPKRLKFQTPDKDSRCMSYGKPTVAAMYLLEGCLGPIRVHLVGLREVPIGNGQRKMVWTYETVVFDRLRKDGLIAPAPILKRDHKKKHSKVIHKWVTSAKGYLLLKEWSKRKDFKPFFDAFCGHITEDDMKKEEICRMFAKGLPHEVMPFWIKMSDKRLFMGASKHEEPEQPLF